MTAPTLGTMDTGGRNRLLWRNQLRLWVYRHGYAGGYWTGGHFFYNTRVNNVNVHIVHNVYTKTVVVHTHT